MNSLNTLHAQLFTTRPGSNAGPRCFLCPHAERERGAAAIVYDRYINNGLDFSLSIPLHWDTITQEERDEWNMIGGTIVRSQGRIIAENNLVSLKHSNPNSAIGLLKITCISQEKFPQFKDADQFAKYNQDLMDTALSKIVGGSHSESVDKKINGIDFKTVQIHFNTRFSSTYHMELMYLYYRGAILTISLGYDNPEDSLEVYKSLETLKMNEGNNL